MKEEFKIIANSIQKEKSILDVGCGDGELMRPWPNIPAG